MEEQVNDQAGGKVVKTCGVSCETEEDRNKPTYCVTDVPPWYLCIFLAIQVPVLCVDFRPEYYIDILYLRHNLFKCQFPGCCEQNMLNIHNIIVVTSNSIYFFNDSKCSPSLPCINPKREIRCIYSPAFLRCGDVILTISY